MKKHANFKPLTEKMHHPTSLFMDMSKACFGHLALFVYSITLSLPPSKFRHPVQRKGNQNRNQIRIRFD